MNKNKISKFTDTIKLRGITSIFLRRKWIFIGFFLAVLVIGLLFTFIKTPVYKSTSVLKLKDVYYEENIYKYFPEESRILGVFAPGMVVEELEGEILTEITRDIRKDALLDEVLEKLDFEIARNELNETIYPLVDRGNRTITIIVSYTDAEGSYQINNLLINTYLENNKNNKSEIIENIIIDIDGRITELRKEYGNLESQNDEEDNIDGELDSINNLIVDLNGIKYSLENNKESYINNIEISGEPVIPAEAANMDNFKSILIAVFAAIAAGLIAVYLPNVFIPFKK
ncbi:MAG: Wzz/FepE/Etk N-terminal domain-containing protein [Actinomycetota bacterium]